MSQTKAQLVGGVGISTVSDLNVYGGLNATGVVTATSFVGDGSGLTGAGSTVADDTTTNGTFYPVLTQTTSGTITSSKVSTSKLSFNPSTGTLSAANVSIAGTLTYEDVTNVDSIGIITARSGIVLGPTANTIQLGTGTTISSPASDTFTISTNGGERVRVDSSGRFGIGINPSSALFEVAGASAQFQNNVVLKASTHATSRRVGISFNDDWVILQDIQGSGTKDFGIYSAALATTIFSIDTSGNFGIGTASPTGGVLHVNGDVNLNLPSDIWSAQGIRGSNNAGILYSHGSFRTSWSCNGYRNNSNLWTSLGINGLSGACQIEQDPGGTILFRTDATKTTGSSSAVTERARISNTGGFSVGTTANPGAGAIYATGNVTAYYSDDRLKTRLGNIENAIEKVCALTGFYYQANETAQELGYQVKKEVGVSAQDVEKVLPEIVTAAPIDEQYKTIHYERLVPLLVEAIKEQQEQIRSQQEQINELRAQMESK